MTTYGPAAFGLTPTAPAPRRHATDRRGEALLALAILGTSLVAIEGVSGATLVGRLPTEGGALLVIAAVQAAWLGLLQRRRTAALTLAAVLNLALVVLWATRPIGVLNTLCALDSLAIVGLALARGRGAALLTQAAITLAVTSAGAAIAGGHTHSGDNAFKSGADTLLCRLA